jgi:hypothetical protein
MACFGRQLEGSPFNWREQRSGRLITPVRFRGPDRNGRVYSFSFGGVIEAFLIGVGALTQAVWLSEQNSKFIKIRSSEEFMGKLWLR